METNKHTHTHTKKFGNEPKSQSRIKLTIFFINEMNKITIFFNHEILKAFEYFFENSSIVAIVMVEIEVEKM